MPVERPKTGRYLLERTDLRSQWVVGELDLGRSTATLRLDYQLETIEGRCAGPRNFPCSETPTSVFTTVSSVLLAGRATWAQGALTLELRRDGGLEVGLRCTPNAGGLECSGKANRLIFGRGGLRVERLAFAPAS